MKLKHGSGLGLHQGLNSPFFSGLFIISAVLLAAWAIITMQKSKLRISPIPAPDALLIIANPYKVVRHPMYTFILSGVGGLLLIHFSWLRQCMAAALVFVLIIKLNGKKMLAEKFSSYKNYMEYTKRIIPYFY